MSSLKSLKKFLALSFIFQLLFINSFAGFAQQNAGDSVTFGTTGNSAPSTDPANISDLDQIERYANEAASQTRVSDLDQQLNIPLDRPILEMPNPEQANADRIFNEGQRRLNSGQYNNRDPYLPGSEEQHIFDAELQRRGEAYSRGHNPSETGTTQGSSDGWFSNSGGCGGDSAYSSGQGPSHDPGSDRFDPETGGEYAEGGCGGQNSHQRSSDEHASDNRTHEHEHAAQGGGYSGTLYGQHGGDVAYVLPSTYVGGGFGGHGILGAIINAVLGGGYGGGFGKGGFRKGGFGVGTAVGAAAGLLLGKAIGGKLGAALGSAAGSAIATALDGGNLKDALIAAGIGAGASLLSEPLSKAVHGLGVLGGVGGLYPLPGGGYSKYPVGGVVAGAAKQAGTVLAPGGDLIVNGDINVDKVGSTIQSGAGNIAANAGNLANSRLPGVGNLGHIGSDSRLARAIDSHAGFSDAQIPSIGPVSLFR